MRGGEREREHNESKCSGYCCGVIGPVTVGDGEHQDNDWGEGLRRREGWGEGEKNLGLKLGKECVLVRTEQIKISELEAGFRFGLQLA